MMMMMKTLARMVRSESLALIFGIGCRKLVTSLPWVTQEPSILGKAVSRKICHDQLPLGIVSAAKLEGD